MTKLNIVLTKRSDFTRSSKKDWPNPKERNAAIRWLINYLDAELEDAVEKASSEENIELFRSAPPTHQNEEDKILSEALALLKKLRASITMPELKHVVCQKSDVKKRRGRPPMTEEELMTWVRRADEDVQKLRRIMTTNLPKYIPSVAIEAAAQRWGVEPETLINHRKRPAHRRKPKKFSATK